MEFAEMGAKAANSAAAVKEPSPWANPHSRQGSDQERRSKIRVARFLPRRSITTPPNRAVKICRNRPREERLPISTSESPRFIM